MTAEQAALFYANLDLAIKVARKHPIPGETDESLRQEALLGLQKAVLAYDPARGAFEPFAWMVIKNYLISALRNVRHRRVELTTLDEDLVESHEDSKKDAIPGREPTPGRETERNEIRAALKAGLAALTPSQRVVLEHYAAGGSFAEVARESGTSEQAVRQMFERGVRQIRPHLESRGVAGAKFLPAARSGMRENLQLFHVPPEKAPESNHLWALVLLALSIGFVWIISFFQ
jgi:RNA polymerase sigma factor (sigma-70 family)